MKQILAVAAAALSVGGCGSLLSKVYADPVVSLENHHRGYAVHCDGTDHDMGDCGNLAQKVCAGPYKTVAQNGAYRNGAKDPEIHRLMIVECVEKCTIASSEHRCSGAD